MTSLLYFTSLQGVNLVDLNNERKMKADRSGDSTNIYPGCCINQDTENGTYQTRVNCLILLLY